ncbi:uracil-DNA glycosylase [Patescibacteria group bacterium]|jgi:uracil-DNA glycosylase|nr:uracil-DNA glycosylase [Patescibacteria group bacterium]
MEVKIEPSWYEVLKEEFEKPYFTGLSAFVRGEYLGAQVYPPPQFVFRAFELTPFDAVRVVILGQDPYINKGEAHGLAFSVMDGTPMPPSLRNVYKEIHDDLNTGRRTSSIGSGDLSHWARQGVLLLNATLTVRAHQSGSHQGKGWEQFTDAVVRHLAEDREGLVFLLWGKYAQQKGAHIDPFKHLVLTAPHPSPFSADRGFFGCKHFSQANSYLEQRGEAPIAWVPDRDRE